jgi:hypothetical protein
VLKLWPGWPTGGGSSQYPPKGGGDQYQDGGGGGGHVKGCPAAGDLPTTSWVVGPYENTVT